VRAPPDGHTLLLCGSPDTFNATLYEKLSFNFIGDIAPVASISRGPLVLVVHPSFPAKTIPEFIAYTKANPDKVNFASAGTTGTVAHMAGELFMSMAGVKLVHVPYRGLGQAMTDLLGGQGNAPHRFQRNADNIEPFAMSASRHPAMGSAWEAPGRAFQGWG
jgi:tripartite-type tricarboxylate transporter receptor subunit TctC